MTYALVHYPAVDPERINEFRSKYDPQFYLIAPHITIMFPVPDFVGEHRLVSHIECILRHWTPFPICLKGLQQSWDEYLFLVLDRGKANVIRLHDEIYTGVLAKYRGDEGLYIPHMTLGVFRAKSKVYARALKEAEQLKLDYECTIDRLHLIKVNDERSQIVWSKEFLFK